MEEKDWCEEFNKEIEEKINEVRKQDISEENIDYLFRLVDIHKDIANEKYWKEKINMNYRYGAYNDYGARGVPGTGRGYRESGSFGRRGVPGSGRSRYRGEEMLDEMYQAYNDYNDGANYGDYGTQESMQKIEVMGDALVDFVEHIKKTVKSPEEREIIDRKIQELSRM